MSINGGKHRMKNLAMKIENNVTLEWQMMGCSKCHNEITRKDYGMQDSRNELRSRGERLSPSSGMGNYDGI